MNCGGILTMSSKCEKGQHPECPIERWPYRCVCDCHTPPAPPKKEASRQVFSKAFDATASSCNIARVIHWNNDMVMVFDHWGQQIPEFQGEAKDVLEKIREAAPHVSIERKVWEP